MKIAVTLAVLAVILVLVTGVIVMLRGGEINRKHANKLMQLRVATQAVAVVIIMVALWLGTQDAG